MKKGEAAAHLNEIPRRRGEQPFAGMPLLIEAKGEYIE
jgi:hypothetical protein